ncbi:phytanoyl-CoA dioxygenase family protein [Dendronalium sp. ChiSLP03b]|uniref:phytanoyl-CoA dioxygenase family protein n=1 Tax=Dendronalium sp. ChiSLP03b TaxID=3075381 RepID=UPI002AD581B5|nr:phytanoyl-CoA dioxygenase family protein [Dendronalium sp. ChiSLP03b]MDZ8209426.1 phytanoyl-CoA dioxygenase family protein [Dendronalium sp. ChiSLP03b]
MLINSFNKYLEEFFTKLYEDCYENYKGLTKNPKWLLMRKVARFKTGRAIMLFFSKHSNHSYLSLINESNSYFKDVNVDEVVGNLKSEGLCLGINLPEDVVQEIVQFAKSTICYGNRKPELGFYYSQKEQAQNQSGKRFTVGSYFNTALCCPAIKKLQNDPKLLAIAAKYLDAQPVHQGNLMWWSFAGETSYREQSQAAQFFHYDIDDYRFVKFFFYLTDVDEQSGPHVCVRGSHKKKSISHTLLRKREIDKDIINYYGVESLVNICGQAGFGFVEDPFCFHKGIPPTHKDRLILQIEFATTDYQMQHDLRENSLLKCIQ